VKSRSVGRPVRPIAPDAELCPGLAHVSDADFRAQDEHRQLPGDPRREVARQLQQESLRRGDHQQARQQAALRRAPAGQRGAVRRQIFDVLGELGVKKCTRVLTSDRKQTIAGEARALHRRMRILPLPPLKTVLALILLIVLAAAGYGAWYALSPLSVSKLPVEVEVARGTGFRAAVDQLERAGIAIHRREFELLARARGRERDIKAGSYEIAAPLTPIELLDRLTRGDVAQAEIRLIEGWTFAQFRAALNESADLRHDSVELDDAQILVQLDVPEEQPEACSSRTPISSPEARATWRSCAGPTAGCSCISRRSGRPATRTCRTARLTRR